MIAGKGVQMDKYRPVRRFNFARLLLPRQLVFEGLDEAGEIQVQFRGPHRVQKEPELAFKVFRNEVRHVKPPGKPVLFHLEQPP